MGNRKIVPLKFGEDTVYMEVAEVTGPIGANDRGGEWEKVSTDQEMVDAGERVTGTLRALASSVKQALQNAEPKEWSIEIELGFDGKTGIPFIAEGGVNGSVKVKVLWERKA